MRRWSGLYRGLCSRRAALVLIGLCVACGSGADDFACTGRDDEVAAEIRTTQAQLNDLRGVTDELFWERFRARVPWFGRHARVERLALALRNLQDEGFMLAIACGEALARRDDLGLITVSRLNGATRRIVELNGAVHVDARRAIGGAASALRGAGHQLTAGLAALANEYDGRTLAYADQDASPPVADDERDQFNGTWLAVLGILAATSLIAVKPVRRALVAARRRALSG